MSALRPATSILFLGDSAGTNYSTGSKSIFIGKNAGFSLDDSNGNPILEDDNIIIGAFAKFLGARGTDNVFIGNLSGYASSGTDNVVIGVEAGRNMTTAGDATIVGEAAGYMLTTGFDNVFIGEDAGYNTTTGSDNTFLGNAAGRLNQTGYRNTAVGNEALYELGNGFQGGAMNVHHNTAIGDSAGYDNGSGNYNTFIGASSGATNEHADFNTFVGAYAGWDNNSTNSTDGANRNTYVGYRTGFTNREGEDNVGMGALSNFDNTDRSRTTFLGAIVDVYNNDVVAVGYNTRASGAQSIAIGSEADVSVDDANAIGYGADIFTSPSAIAIGREVSVNNGNFSIAIGRDAAISAAKSIALGNATNITAADAIAIGDSASATDANSIVLGSDASVSAANSIAMGKGATVSAANAMALGYQASVSAANKIYLGNSAITSIGSIVNWTATSDGRVKQGVQEDVVGLEFIEQLRPVTYTYDTEKLNKLQGKKSSESLREANAAKEQIRYSGFIAQEVAAAADAVGYVFSGVDKPQVDKDIYGLRYAEFVVPAVKAAQELHTKVRSLENHIERQNARISHYQQMLDERNKYLTSYRNIMAKMEARLVALENSGNGSAKQPRALLTSLGKRIDENTVIVGYVSELENSKAMSTNNLPNQEAF